MNPDINAEILAELRNMRRHAQSEAYFMILVALVLIAYMTWSVLERQRGGTPPPPAAATKALSSDEVWSRASAALDEGENERAVSIVEDFVARRPNYHYSHVLLGSVYLQTGDFTNAEAAYVRATDIYPDEEYEKTLAAIRKRLAKDRTKAAVSK